MLPFKQFLIAKFQKTLNPKIWNDDNTIKPEVQDHLVKVANMFIDTQKIPKDSITDVVLTGSNANFNWTQSSDLDVHILIDPDYFAKEGACELFSIEDVIQTKKALWNDKHSIAIYGFPVEIYATTQTEKIVENSGVYSLVSKSWISKPQRVQISIDSGQVQAKADELISEINTIINSNCDDETKVESLLDRIADMRQSGLHTGGEYSVENLAFKVIRNTGDLDKIRQYYSDLQDREMSLA